MSTQTESQILNFRQRLIEKSKTFDWSIPEGSIDQYISLYARAQEKPTLLEIEKRNNFKNQYRLNGGFEMENRFSAKQKLENPSLPHVQLWPYYNK